LTDKTTATAVLLPTQDGDAWLVYATKTGLIGLYRLTATLPPQPEPTPPVPPVPPTPPPAKPTALIIITDTPTNQGTWTTPATARLLASRGISTTNYAISYVNDPNYSDVVGLKWIGKSAGNATPYAFLVDAAGTTTWSGAVPASDDAWAAILNAQPATATRCPGGVCPTTRERKRK